MVMRLYCGYQGGRIQVPSKYRLGLEQADSALMAVCFGGDMLVCPRSRASEGSGHSTETQLR